MITDEAMMLYVRIMIFLSVLLVSNRITDDGRGRHILNGGRSFHRFASTRPILLHPI